MNLHAIAGPIVAAVNPTIQVSVRISAGTYTTAPDGTRTPIYVDGGTIPAQIQSLTADELRQLEGLNIQGTKRGIYLHGKYDGVNRVAHKGGDLITYPEGSTYPFGTSWLVVHVLEQWPDWCKVAVTQQLP